MLSELLKKQKSALRVVPKPEADVNIPIRTSYLSNDIAIPDDFLSCTKLPEDKKPITVTPIDFSNTEVPEYAGRYAVILDNVISPSECAKLIQLAEASVPMPERPGGEASSSTNGAPAEKPDPWSPALVNIGGGWEILQADYRNSDRIIWDQEVVTGRLWNRIAKGAPEVANYLNCIEADEVVLGGTRCLEQRWMLKALNKRMRFLRYGPGMFFRPHCDGSYEVEGLAPGRRIRTLLTLHLYLNDSAAAVGQGATLIGGSTPFLSRDEKRRVDVHPKAGRVLIFQHRGLYHSGDDVVEGTKYTVRSDILYELTRQPAPEEREED